MRMTIESLIRGDHIEQGFVVDHVKVYRNGKEVDYCFALDTDEGWVDCYIMDYNNVAYTTSEGSLLTVRLFGKITVEDTRSYIPPPV